jgi:hypothetical protein
MNLRRLALVVLATLISASAAFPQTTAPGPQPVVRIVAPRAGEKISANFVTVRFELMNPAATAGASPNFQVRLDGRDPVRTTDTEFTFSGLVPGQHTAIVELVDANNTPINGSRTQVQFSVTQQQPMPTETAPDHSDIVRQTSAGIGGARFVPAVMSWVEKDDPPQAAGPSPAPAPDARSAHPAPRASEQLPRSSTALPLLSVIGLGVLLGGLVSALRTR